MKTYKQPRIEIIKSETSCVFLAGSRHETPIVDPGADKGTDGGGGNIVMAKHFNAWEDELQDPMDKCGW